MPKIIPAHIQWAQYLGARLAAMGLTAFEPEANLKTAAWIGRLIHAVDKKHRVRMQKHLRIAFPEATQTQLDVLGVKSFEHFMQLVMEVLHTPRVIHPDSWPAHVRLRNMGPAIKLLNSGSPAILVTGHLGNWEVLGALLAVLGYPCHAIARPLDNVLLNDWLLGVRERRGMQIITKWDASDKMVEVLSGGGMLGFIADQNAGDKGMFVPFFGRLASTYKSIGLLAISQRVPVLCGYAHRMGNRFEYEMGVMDIIRPEEWEAQRDPLFYVTARYMLAIENMIRLRPEQYLWMHRRWKSRPKYERDGKPMPESVKRGLGELPWMTPALMESLCQPFKEA